MNLVSLLAALAALVVVVQHLAGISALGGGELHRPEEVRHGFELGTHCVYLVDDVLDAVNALVTYEQTTESGSTYHTYIYRYFMVLKNS